MRSLPTTSDQQNEPRYDTWEPHFMWRTPAPWWVRGCLVVVAIGLIGVFGIALWLNPYTKHGSARQWETHRQMGLPECSFKTMTKLPCPSCGMTTSFSLLIRGDLWNSLWANWVGTLLAAVCLLFIPWAFVSAWQGRTVGVTDFEIWLCRFLIVFVSLMLLRWFVVVGWMMSQREYLDAL